MTRFAPLHMQDSRQYSINIKANTSLYLQISMKERHNVKIGQTPMSEIFTESDTDL